MQKNSPRQCFTIIYYIFDSNYYCIYVFLPGNGCMRFECSGETESATNTWGLVTSVPGRVAGCVSSRVQLISLDVSIAFMSIGPMSTIVNR